MKAKITIPEHLIPPKPTDGQIIVDLDTDKLWIYCEANEEWIDFDEFMGLVAKATKQIEEAFKDMASTFQKALRSRIIKNDSKKKN